MLSTLGADAATVRRLADSLGKAVVVADPADLRQKRPSMRRLFVVGWGPDAAEWHALDSIPVSFHPTPLAPGISRASWPAEVVLGDRLVVEGDVAAAPGGQPIYLDDPSGTTDSTRIDSSGAFRLEARPRATGRSLYVLHTATADRAVATETLAVTVVAPPAWRVLILERSPRFETSALRDWLVARGGAVAIRTAVSRNRFRTEFVNRDRVPLTTLTSRLVAQFDLTVIDGRTLAALTASERLTLRRAVDGGLGVLVIPDTVVFDHATGRFSDRDFFLDFSLRPIDAIDVRLVRPRWAGLDRPATVPASAAPYVLGDRFGTESLIEDGTGNVLAQVAPRGAGRVGLSLVTGSARWQRGGERETFSAYWSRVLSAVAGGPTADRWTIETPGPWLMHRPLVVDVETTAERQLTLVVAPSGARDSVFLARDPLAPTRWRGTFWPRESGWHEIADASGTAFYVQPTGAWRSQQGAARLDATSRHLVYAARVSTDQPVPPESTSQPIPVEWFFGVFLLSAGYLWSLRRTG